MFNDFDFKKISNSAYICFEKNLRQNLEILREIKDNSEAKILLALKGFSFTLALDIVKEYLDGFTCSGLWEAKLAAKYTTKDHIHTYSPAFGNDFLQIKSISSHIVFNSISMLEKYAKECQENSIFLRCNPLKSFAPVELYNPCGKYSRFGITKDEIEKVQDFALDGLHFHALCEEGSDSLEEVLKVFEKDFASLIKKVKWVNFGGGHLITSPNYDKKKLIKLINDFKQKWGVGVILEPGEAVGLNTGVLSANVLDILKKGDKNIAVLDISAEAHMPDTIIMPYTSKVLNAKIISDKSKINDDLTQKQLKFCQNPYILAGNTCLSGDIMGFYDFEKPLQIGDKVVFLDQIHYSIVKNTTFNGIKLPSLYLIDKYGNTKNYKDFDFSDFLRRN